MTVRPLHDPRAGVLRVVGLLSGSGTNIRRILEHERKLAAERGQSPFELVALFSDNADSKAAEIGREFDLPVVVRDIRAFYKRRGRPKRDLGLRPDYDRLTVAALAPFQARAAVYGGYMSVASEPLIRAFLGLNVHPADLSVERDGKRRWVGDHAVRDAIVAGERTIAATTHLIEPEVDGGRLLMISKPLTVELAPGADLADPTQAQAVEQHNQNRLKEAGDWVIFPLTLQYLAEGRFGADESGVLHFDGRPIPKGLRAS